MGLQYFPSIWTVGKSLCWSMVRLVLVAGLRRYVGEVQRFDVWHYDGQPF